MSARTFLRRRPVRIVLCSAGIALCCLALSGCSYIEALRCRSRIRTELLTPKRHDPARLDVCGNIPILHLYGTQKEMGAQYGTILKTPLQALDTYLRTLLPKKKFQQFLDFARKNETALPSSYREELRAIADAAGVPYLDLVAINVLPSNRCTTFAAWGEASRDRSLIMGRNTDYLSFGLGDRASMIVVYHSTDGIPFASVGVLGIIGSFTGINAKGVAFGNMIIQNAKDAQIQNDGLPIQIALRMAAHECAAAKDMIDFLRAHRRMRAMNVMAADAGEALVVELACHGDDVRRGERGALFASNHFRSPDLRACEVHCGRYESLVRAAKDQHGSLDVEAMKKALYSARIPVINLQAVVFEPAAMRMHLSINRYPASAGPYTAFDVTELLRSLSTEAGAGQ